MMKTRALLLSPASLVTQLCALMVTHLGYTADQAAEAWKKAGTDGNGVEWQWLSADISEEKWIIVQALHVSLPQVDVLEYDFVNDPDFPEAIKSERGLMLNYQAGGVLI